MDSSQSIVSDSAAAGGGGGGGGGGDDDNDTIVPILLLKTESTSGGDSYRDKLTAAKLPSHGLDRRRRLAAPDFIPVMRHTLDSDALSALRTLLHARKISRRRRWCRDRDDTEFGGIIFTSQRAVEAFSAVVVGALVEESADEQPVQEEEAEAEEDEGEDEDEDGPWPHLQQVPLYSVGPATTRALAAVSAALVEANERNSRGRRRGRKSRDSLGSSLPPLRIYGEHTGNGAALARFILDHYEAWHRDDDPQQQQQQQQQPLLPLLFLVGEHRRDIIPKTLADATLPPHRRIHVVEKIVYGTAVMDSFSDDFARALRQAKTKTTTTTMTMTTSVPLKKRPSWKLPSVWVVVFSPTGCESMLRQLGLLDDDSGRVRRRNKLRRHDDDEDDDDDDGDDDDGGSSNVFIATIGPTTRSHLLDTFGLEPHVCAATPSPEGVLEGIVEFEARIIASASTSTST